ncbi:hypothetical protein [Streptomyces sp. NPDC096339]|uniref:hypothetical protein n=1 Tax=Streptomyces sp. NPDC096339 TaxID=3366086 RepID=UPI003815D1CA
MTTPTTDDAATEPVPKPDPDPEPGTVLAALGWAAAVTAAALAAGYAASRWASTGYPLEPLPGSPWPYLAVWGTLCLAGCLLLRWATRLRAMEGNGYALLAVTVAGIRLSLAHRPDTALLWLYGGSALALAASATALGRLRGRRAA